MKQGKRIKPKFPVEYRLLIVHREKERERKSVTLFALRTVNEFTSFRYEIVVQPEVSGRTIRLGIHGLRAPQVTIPGTGPAVYQIEYEHLKGTYNIIVAKLDGEENSCSIQISGDTVTLKEFTPGGFVDVVTSEEEW